MNSKKKKKSCDQLESTRNNLDSVTNTIKIRKESVFFFFFLEEKNQLLLLICHDFFFFYLLVPLKMPWFKLESNEIARIVFLLFFCIFLMIDWTKQLSWSLCSHHWIMTNNFLGTLDYFTLTQLSRADLVLVHTAHFSFLFFFFLKWILTFKKKNETW